MKNSIVSTGALVAALVVSVPNPSSAQSLDKHEHGVGEMTMVLDGKTLAIEIDVPGADIVGFEHAAESDADVKAVHAALKVLMDPAHLFGMAPAAKCRVAEATATSSLLDDDHAHGDEGHDKHDDHAHKDEAHDKHDDHAHKDEAHDKHDDHAHKDEAHDKHDDHAHKGEHADAEPHGGFVAHYVFTCNKPEVLSGIEVHLFDRFASLREVNVQIAGPGGQAAARLHKGETKLVMPE